MTKKPIDKTDNAIKKSELDNAIEKSNTDSDELDRIRAKKVAKVGERIDAFQKDIDEITAMKSDFTWADFGHDEPEWGFRESEEMPSAFDVCQNGQTVALTGDPKWAMLVCDLLNRARLEELIMSYHKGENKDE